MQNYDYPPSQQIRLYEPFEPNSHFYVRGKCHFNGKKYPCDFEVAYALSGEIYIVAYFATMIHHELFSIREDESIPIALFTPKKERIAVKFYGLDLRYGHHVYINNAISLSNGLTSISPNNPVFVADYFELRNTDKDVLYSYPQSTTSFEFEIVNIKTTIPFSELFNVGDLHALSLRVSSDQITENPTSQENAILSIPRKSIPVGLKVEDIADIWCAAVSMATGNDIRWIVKHSRTSHKIVHKFIRRRNLIRNRSTYGLITDEYMFWRDRNVLEFILTVFTSIRSRKISKQAMRDYSRIMWHFVEYCLITNRVEDQARLITTTVEELLILWEKHTGNAATAIVTVEEADKLWLDLKENWLPKIDSVLGSIPNQRKTEISNRLQTSFLQEIVRPGFRKRLKRMLETGQNDRMWIINHADPRIDLFVTTRNKIAHEGRFPTEDTDDLFNHYFDMLMVLPILIFSIFGYQGSYNDLSKKQRSFYQRKKAQE